MPPVEKDDWSLKVAHDTQAKTKLRKVDQAENERTTWKSRIKTILFTGTMISFHVGSSNLTRFPIDVMKYGGLWYVFVYFVLLLIVGWPLSFFECLIGQLTQMGLTKAFEVYGRVFKGVGMAIIFASVSVMLVESSLLGHNISTFYSSLTTLAHLRCQNPWNTESCTSLYDNIGCPDEEIFFRGHCTSPESISNSSMDAAFEHYRESVAPDHFDLVGFFATILFCYVALGLALFGHTALMGLFTSIGTVSVSLIIVLLSRTLYYNSFQASWTHLMRYTRFQAMFSLKALASLTSTMLYSISLGGANIATLGSFRAPKDNCFHATFIALMVDFACNIFGMLMFFGVLQEAMTHSPNSSHLFAAIEPDDVRVSFIPQIMANSANGRAWIIFWELLQILLHIPYMLSPAFLVLAIVRDHTSSQLAKVIVFGSTATGVTVTFAFLSTEFGRSLAAVFNHISPYELCIRPLFYLGILVIVLIYGKTELLIDLSEIFREQEGWRRWFAPDGIIMAVGITKLGPGIILIGQMFILSDKMVDTKTLSTSESIIAWSLPLLCILIVPAYAVHAFFTRDKFNESGIWQMFYPTSEHPSYYRITAEYEECLIQEVDNQEPSSDFTDGHEMSEAKTSDSNINLEEKAVEPTKDVVPFTGNNPLKL